MRRFRVVVGVAVGKWSWEGEECAACLLEIEDRQAKINCPSCKAPFHQGCYDNLLKSKPECPSCRVKLTLETNGQYRT